LLKWKICTNDNPTIDLETAQGYCVFVSLLVENGMITQEVHLVAPGRYSQIGKGKGC
jgi:hypothetical protein